LSNPRLFLIIREPTQATSVEINSHIRPATIASSIAAAPKNVPNGSS
jgi:hypothetical protein